MARKDKNVNDLYDGKKISYSITSLKKLLPCFNKCTLAIKIYNYFLEEFAGE